MQVLDGVSAVIDLIYITRYIYIDNANKHRTLTKYND